MQHHTLNTAFVRQFQQESILYSWQGKQHYGNVRFRQFAGKKNETASLGRLLAKKLDYSATGNDLIRKLKEEDIPDTRKLFEFSHKLLRKFASYMQDEPCTKAYYDKLLAILKPFLALIKIYQGNMQQPLLQTLTSFFSDEAELEEAAALSSDDLDAVRELMIRFQDEMYGYYEVFNLFIQQESNDGCYIRVVSKVEHYVLKIMTMIEKVAHNTQFLVSRIEEWDAQMADREAEELYN